jgi:hypothetical protein
MATTKPRDLQKGAFFRLELLCSSWELRLIYQSEETLYWLIAF